jgi:hypothetical protein
MKRLIAAGLVAVLATVLAGCAKEPPPAPDPEETTKASDMFDKKFVPPNPYNAKGASGE